MTARFRIVGAQANQAAVEGCGMHQPGETLEEGREKGETPSVGRTATGEGSTKRKGVIKTERITPAVIVL